jgi:hypothetical protein
VTGVIRDHLDAAIIGKQLVGVEIEFTPKGGRAQTIDDAYTALKTKLEAEGYQVTLHPAKPNFVYGAKPGIFVNTSGTFTWSDRTIYTSLLVATSSIMHTVTIDDDDSVRLRARANNEADAYEELLQRVADKFRAGPVASIKELIRAGAPFYTQTVMYLLKDDDGDIAKIKVTLPEKGKARLTGDNCLIYDAQGQAQSFIDIEVAGVTDAERFKAVNAYLHEHMPHSTFAKKINQYGGLSVEGIGTPDDNRFQIVVEAHPDLELITPKLAPDQTQIVEHLVTALRDWGFEGTRAANVVGIHVHAGLPLLGRNLMGVRLPTIAPIVNMMRAFGRDTSLILSAFPTHFNRAGFIHEISGELVKLMSQPRYVTDPNDVRQILRVCADIVRYTRTKYTAMNLDNHISKLLGLMLLGDEKAGIKPVLTEDQYSTTYRGLEYGFVVVRTGDEVSLRLLTLLPKDRPLDEHGNKPDYVEIIRMKKTAWKPTTEFRIFDTIMQDPRIAALNMQFVAAYTYLYGKDYLVPYDEMFPTLPDHEAQHGFVTVQALAWPAFAAVDFVRSAQEAAKRLLASGWSALANRNRSPAPVLLVSKPTPIEAARMRATGLKGPLRPFWRERSHARPVAAPSLFDIHRHGRGK